MRTTYATGILIGLLAVPAAAEVKPEITFLIDAPHRAQMRMDGTPPQCLGRDVDQPGGLDPLLTAQNRPRLQIIKEVLGGHSRDPFWCREYDAQWRAANAASLMYGTDGLGSTYRAMCCAARLAGVCRAWAPCGNDHGSSLLAAADDATPLGYGVDGAFNQDGVLHQFSALNQGIKFGILVGEAEAVNLNPLSFGGERAQAGNAAFVAGQATRYGLALRADGQAVGAGQDWINIGIRDDADRFGRRQPGHRGTLVGGLFDRLVALTETISAVVSHNALVAQQVRDILPHGHTNLSAMLSDAVRHYARIDAGSDGEVADGAALCRWRALVVISDGVDTPMYGGEGCQIGANNEPVLESPDCSAGRGACMRLPALDEQLQEKGCPCEGANEVCLAKNPADPNSPQVCMVPACRYPEGFPYDKADVYARQLYDMGVVVFPVAFGATADGLERMKRIAAAGSPGAGPAGRDGWFVANTEEALRDALVRVANNAFVERTPAGSPVATVPGVGDTFQGSLANKDIRQIRMYAFTESGESGDSASYGRVQQQVLGCEGDPAPGERSIKLLADRRLDQGYIDQVGVRTVSRDPIARTVFTVTGGATPMFNDDGVPRAADLNNARTFTGTADDAKLEAIGDLFHGFFGDVGLPPAPAEGEDPVAPQRQLGAIRDGDRALIETPAIGLALPSYERFYQAQRRRPTMLVTGARDGKIHALRADTGDEVFSFVPRASWAEVKNGGFAADGPLNVRDLVGCRSLGAGGGDCPAELTEASFRTVIVGGTGVGGANLFGLDVTKATSLAAEDGVGGFDAQASFSEGGASLVWNVTSGGLSNFQVAKLGQAVSRPVLAHVRVGDEIRAAAVVGCGDDTDSNRATAANANAPGRCILILDARTGEPLAELVSATMLYPMVGSPAVFPATGTAPIERVYLGDRVGNLFRVDLRDSNPDNWTVARAWPPEDFADDSPVVDGEYTTGRALLGAPAVATAEDGNLVVVFAQGSKGAPDEAAHVVSFTDRTVIQNNVVSFEAFGNWVLKLRAGESVVSEPSVVDGVVYTTTTDEPAGEDVCLPSISRLYAMHYEDITVDDDGDKRSYTRADDGQALYVKPMLPRFQNDGTPDDPALSLVLPPGIKAYGMTIVRTPSCRQEEGPTTDLLLTAAADDQQGAGGGRAAGGVNRQKIEYVSDNNSLVQADYDRSVFVESSSVGLRVCLNCDRDGRAVQGFGGRLSPFPSRVVFWGSTFTD
ncbi:MAG: hypothetical protein H6702_00905 [Myxococcales bacterium]|nr:hypothetical protein [Myxococcales bacterium]